MPLYLLILKASLLTRLLNNLTLITFAIKDNKIDYSNSSGKLDGQLPRFSQVLSRF